MNKIVQNGLKFGVPLIIGVAIIWYLYREVSISEIKDVLSSGVEWSWIILSLVLALCSHILRGIRWQYQLRTIVDRPPINDLVNSVFGAYGVNLILPRMGELWRCNFIAKRLNQPFSTILGTVISERFVDMVSVALITLIAFIAERNFFFSFFRNHPTIANSLIVLVKSPYCYLALALIIGGLIVFFKNGGRFKFIEKIISILKRIWEGAKTIMLMKHKWMFIFLTAAIWILYFFNFYVCLFAFEFSRDLGILDALSMFVMGSIAVVVPVQGGIGPWHFMIISTMMYYGVGETEASTFALVVHAIQQGFVLLLGAYALIFINLKYRVLKRK